MQSQREMKYANVRYVSGQLEIICSEIGLLGCGGSDK